MKRTDSNEWLFNGLPQKSTNHHKSSIDEQFSIAMSGNQRVFFWNVLFLSCCTLFSFSGGMELMEFTNLAHQPSKQALYNMFVSFFGWLHKSHSNPKKCFSLAHQLSAEACVFVSFSRGISITSWKCRNSETSSGARPSGLRHPCLPCPVPRQGLFLGLPVRNVRAFRWSLGMAGVEGELGRRLERRLW